MKTRPVVVFSNNYDVLILEQTTFRRATANLKVGEQVSFWSSPGETLAKRTLGHTCRMVLSEQSNLVNTTQMRKKSQTNVRKPSGSVDQQPSDSGHGLSGGTAHFEVFATARTSSAENWYDNDGFDMEMSEYRGLVLDLSYRPINVVCWRRALCLEILEKADVLEYYDQAISSPGRAYLIPAVLRITDYVHAPKWKKVKLALSRKNIFLRDKYRCQYCNARDNLTVDHVVPVSRGGGWTWENLVTACSRCNLKKGDKTMEEVKMELLRPAKEPKEMDGSQMPSSYAAYRTLNSAKRMPNQWLDYLSKRSPQN
eukprot:c26419_g1_i1 orf=363-1298(-)